MVREQKKYRSSYTISFLVMVVVGCFCFLNNCSSFDSNNDDHGFIEGEGLRQGAVDIPLMPHPKEPTAWHTRIIMVNQSMDLTSEVSKCRDEVDAAARIATDQEGFLEARNSLIAALQDLPEAYHWCFYQIVTKLDQRLELTTTSLKEKVNTFFSTMKQLWILARALDAANDMSSNQVYFDYLRTRYINLSHQYFGRRVEVMGDALDLHFQRQRDAKSDE